MRLAAIAAALAVSCGVLAARAAPALPKIYVGPNVRVSTDSNGSHFEDMIASGPGGLMIASANLTGGDQNAWITKAYVSTDDGNRWFSVWFARLSTSPAYDASLISGDATVAAGSGGRLFFASLCAPSPGAHALVTCLYRSDDKGVSWKGSTLQIADHERFLTDPSTGSVIVVGKGEGRAQTLVLYRSADNGTVMHGPFVFAHVTGIAYDPCRLPGGAVFLPFVREDKATMTLEGVVMSRDGAFSKPFPLYAQTGEPLPKLLAQRAFYVLHADFADENAAMPVFLSHGPEIYAVANSLRNGVYRIVARISRDEGRHWSAPRFITPPGTHAQFAPSAAVSTDGVLGVAWAQTVTPATYDERFTASVDGGASFLLPRTLSTADSAPFNSDNLAGRASSFGGSFMQFSGFTTRPSGGDYFGMTVDARGVFHPAWIDVRDGIGAQIYTAPVALLHEAPACLAPSPVVDLTKQLIPSFDPVRVDASDRELVFSMRLRNAGSDPIADPVTFTVRKLQADEFIAPSVRIPAAAYPAFENAANHLAGVGATFDFSNQFGDSHVLEPGSVTNPVEIRLHVYNPQMMQPVVTGTVTGRRCSHV